MHYFLPTPTFLLINFGSFSVLCDVFRYFKLSTTLHDSDSVVLSKWYIAFYLLSLCVLWVMVMVRHGSFVSPQPPDLPGPTRTCATCHMPSSVPPLEPGPDPVGGMLVRGDLDPIQG